MALIRVTPEELETQGGSIKSLAEEITDKLTQLDNIINTVVDEWDGLAQDTFYDKYTELAEQLKTFPEVVTGIGEQIISVAKVFSETDSQLSSAFNSKQ